jgi:hypothetical protein
MKELHRFHGKYSLCCISDDCKNEYPGLGKPKNLEKGAKASKYGYVPTDIYIYKGTGYCYDHLPSEARDAVKLRRGLSL